MSEPFFIVYSPDWDSWHVESKSSPYPLGDEVFKSQAEAQEFCDFQNQGFNIFSGALLDTQANQVEEGK